MLGVVLNSNDFITCLIPGANKFVLVIFEKLERILMVNQGSWGATLGATIEFDHLLKYLGKSTSANGFKQVLGL